MRIAKVIGNVTLNRALPSFAGARLKLAIPMMLDELADSDRPVEQLQTEELTVWDEQGAGIGSLIAVSEGAEATQPFRPELKPVDAYASAILDNIHIDKKLID